MAQPAKCAHPACDCQVPEKGRYGKYCSEHCKDAQQMTMLRCECPHPECRAQHAATPGSAGAGAI